MVNVDTIRFVMGIFGNIISVGLFLAPLPTFYGIVKKKDAEEFHPYPYLAALVNCALWVFYGNVHPDSTLVVTINGFGLVVEVVYLSTFFLYTKRNHRKSMGVVLLVEIVFMAAIVVCTLKFLHTTVIRSAVVGGFCMACNILMYMSPLSNIMTVIKKKDATFIPFWLCLAGFFNGICWFAYGFLKTFDYNLVVPNGLGAFFSAITLILCFVYGNNKQQIDVKPQKNVQLADVV